MDLNGIFSTTIFCITLKAWAWASSSSNAFILKCDLFKSVKERFDAEKNEIPYPYFNQIIKQDVPQ